MTSLIQKFIANNSYKDVLLYQEKFGLIVRRREDAPF